MSDFRQVMFRLGFSTLQAAIILLWLQLNALKSFSPELLNYPPYLRALPRFFMSQFAHFTLYTLYYIMRTLYFHVINTDLVPRQ